MTLIPKSLFNNITPLHPLETKYRDVDDNRIKFEGKTTAMVNINGKQKHLEILVTTNKTNPLLGLDWMKKLGITLEKKQNRHANKQHQRRSKRKDAQETVQETIQRKLHGKWNGSRNTTEGRREINPTEREAHTDSLTTIGWKGNRETNETRPHQKSERYRRKLLCEPGGHHNQERQVGKDSFRFEKTK